MIPQDIVESPQWFANRAYVTCRYENIAQTEALLRSFSIVFSSTSSVENGLREYEIVCGFDTYNSLGSAIRNSGILCVLSRNKNANIAIAQSGYNQNDPNQTKVEIAGLVAAATAQLWTNTSGKVLYLSDIYFFDTVNGMTIRLRDGTNGAAPIVFSRVMNPDPTLIGYTGAIDLTGLSVRFTVGVFIDIVAGAFNLNYNLQGWEQ